MRHLRQSFHGTSGVSPSHVACQHQSDHRIQSVLVMVLGLLVGRTARAIRPFIDETGRMLRDCVVYLRKGFGACSPNPQGSSSVSKSGSSSSAIPRLYRTIGWLPASKSWSGCCL
jgi:hypothetical protein